MNGDYITVTLCVTKVMTTSQPVDHLVKWYQSVHQLAKWSLKAIVLALANYKIMKCMIKIISYITGKSDVKNFGVNTKISWKLDVKSLTFARHSFDSDWILAMSWSSFLISSSYSPLSLMIFSFLCSICCISLVIAPMAPFCNFTSFSNFWTVAYCKIKERKSTI